MKILGRRRDLNFPKDFICTGFFNRNVFFKLMTFLPVREDFPLVKSFLCRLLTNILRYKSFCTVLTINFDLEPLKLQFIL